ncbi:MAG: stage III sporulation protein AA [Christensenellaceae bacterium]|jgi:stage III sporulation protein AA|nr:stage III sporulation protein AA [Christensenellaceae bacterium]
MERLCGLFCEPFKKKLLALPREAFAELRELRIRVGQQPLLLGAGERVLSGFRPTRAEMEQLFLHFCGNSPYAYEEQIAAGYLTLPGGHRVGLCGHAVLRQGSLQRLDGIQGMNLRVARDVEPEKRLLKAVTRAGSALNTLVISSPGLGKTTLLRGLARLLSESGLQVGVVDERGELAAMERGVPQMDLGARADVMDFCPKSQAIPLLVRAMAPQVIVTDELGGADDLSALNEASRCGVAVIASAHGRDLGDIRARPTLGEIERRFPFERYIVLAGAPGRVQGVYDREGRACSYA